MSNLAAKIHEVAHTVERLDVPAIDTQAGAQNTALDAQNTGGSTAHGRIPLTVRSRLRVLRVSPPIDDGFRPFRVF